MKRVYLIRHGAPDFPGGQRMCLGSTELPLSEEGWLQSKAMANALPPVTAVFSSPLLRAVQTARVIGLPVNILPGLRELDAGAWDGLTFREIRERYPALYEARGTDPSLLPPGAEAPDQGRLRFRGAMEEAAGRAPGDLAVVAHGGIIAAFLESLGEKKQKPNYVQVISLGWENGRFWIMEENAHA